MSKTAYYPFLDGFRCFSILWVLLHHLHTNFTLGKFFPVPLIAVFERFANIGLIGVDIFFVISGFLISGLLFDNFEKSPLIKRFYIRRFFKIIPQYLLVVIVGILCTALIPLTTNQIFFKSFSYLLFFQNYIEPLRILSHLWSIAVEEHFYFFYPLLLWGIYKIGQTPSQRRKILFWIIIVSIFAIFILRRYIFIKYTYNSLLLFQMTHIRIDALLIGCLIKLMEPSLTLWPTLWKKWTSYFCAATSVGAFIFLFIYFDPCRSTGYVVAYVMGGSLLLSALMGFRPLLFISELNILRFIGRSSYAIYLWHYPAIILFQHYLSQPISILQLMIITTLCIGLGIISTFTIERYFLNLREKL